MVSFADRNENEIPPEEFLKTEKLPGGTFVTNIARFFCQCDWKMKRLIFIKSYYFPYVFFIPFAIKVCYHDRADVQPDEGSRTRQEMEYVRVKGKEDIQ